MPLTNTAQAPENHVSEKSSAKHWVIISGALALVVIVLASVLGYLAWKGNNRSAGESSGVSSNTQTNNNVPTKGDSEAAAKTQPSESTSFQWLDGVWEGKGYQSNTKSTWTIRLTVQNGTYVIEYPSIPCSGRWTLIKQDTVEATFNERITQGLNRCVENGSVVIEKIDDSQVSCKYSAPPAKGVIATAILRKTAQSPEQK